MEKTNKTEKTDKINKINKIEKIKINVLIAFFVIPAFLVIPAFRDRHLASGTRQFGIYLMITCLVHHVIKLDFVT